MDQSVIEINDSIITIDSDADVEDGEVLEISTEKTNSAANLQQPPIEEPNETTNHKVQQSERE